MSTRSMIFRKNENGIYEGIYSHWDGYIENNGYILDKYYQDEDKVKALISLGDISSLDKELPVIPKYKTQKIVPEANQVSPYRVNLEEEPNIDIFRNYDEMIKEINDDIFIEYIYIYENNKWTVIDKFQSTRRLSLKNAVRKLCEE